MGPFFKSLSGKSLIGKTLLWCLAAVALTGALAGAPALAHDKSKTANASDAQTDADDNAIAEDGDTEDEDLDTAQIAPYKGGGAAPGESNGIGPDPDGDSNPATNTRTFAKIGDAAEASFDPPYRVVTFEAPPGAHQDKIVTQYAEKYGVRFSKGLRRQICEGQRYFRYDSQCTYRAAPSGKYAAVYRDDFHRPLTIEFQKPVCVAALAIYPTGGKEGERFEVSLQGYDKNGRKLDPAKIQFTWTDYTFRWRNMVGAYFLNNPATRVDVNVRSFTKKPKRDDAADNDVDDGAKDDEDALEEDDDDELVEDRTKIVRFLIDDVAFIDDGCDKELRAVEDAV